MDSGVLWRHRLAEFLSAAILFSRRAAHSYTSSVIRCCIQDRSCCSDVAVACGYMVADVPALRKGSDSGNGGGAGIDAVVGRQPLHQFNRRHWTQSHLDISAWTLHPAARLRAADCLVCDLFVSKVEYFALRVFSGVAGTGLAREFLQLECRRVDGGDGCWV